MNLATEALPLSGAPGGTGTLAVLGALALVLVGARLGAALFRRLGQPEVLGELVTGVVFGNLHLIGLGARGAWLELPGLDLLAEIGVLFLLFMTGLESELKALMRVGASSLMVATLGVVAPIGLGYLISSWLAPGHSPLVHWFVGATLCATSVGITARVLGELGRTASAAGRIILGAAVIDDVLGLVVLAVVSGVIRAADRGEGFHVRLGAAGGRQGGAVPGGRDRTGPLDLAPHVPHRRPARGAGPAAVAVAGRVCFGLSWLAGTLGLAPIVGAFAAGLVLESVHYRALRERDHQRRTVARAARADRARFSFRCSSC